MPDMDTEVNDRKPDEIKEDENDDEDDLVLDDRGEQHRLQFANGYACKRQRLKLRPWLLPMRS